MPQYTVKDEQSGRTVTFDWAGAEPPTDADMEEVFAEADTFAEQQVRDRPPSMAELDMGFGAGGVTEDDRVRVQQEGRKMLPLIGGGIGGLFGGPVAAGIGAAAGKLAERGLEGDIDLTDAKDAAVEGGMTAAGGAIAGKAVTAGLRYAGPALQRMAVRPMMAAMKIDRGALEKLPGIRRKGIAKAEREIAQFAINENVNPVKANRGLILRGSRGIDDGIEEKLSRTSVARLRRAARAPDEPIAGGAANVNAALDDVAKWAEKGDASQKRVSAVRALSDDVRTDPGQSEQLVSGVGYSAPRNAATGKPQLRASHSADRDVRQLRDMTPLEEVESIRSNNELLNKAFKDGLTSPDVKVRRAVQKARTENLDRAAGTAPLSNRMRDLINLKAVGNVATRRADASNPLSLTDAISGATGRTGILAASVAMKSPVLAELALLMNRTGRSMGKSVPAERVRSLLGSLLASHGSE